MTFAMTLLFMGLVFWRPQDWLVPQLYGWPLLDVVVFVALLTLLMELDQKRVRFPSRMPQPMLLGGLWVAAVLSHVAHGYLGGVMDTIPEVFKYCFFTLLFLCVLDRPSRLRAVCRVIVGMTLFMAVHAILQDRRGYGFGPMGLIWVRPHGEEPGYTRTLFYGIFEDPNDMAQMFATSLPLTFVIFKKQNVFTLAFGCICSYVLIRALGTTHSDGGMVALIASTAIMVLSIFSAKWSARLMAAGIMGGLLACPMSAGFMDLAAHDRVVFWGMANRAFLRNPIFGVGYEMFWQVSDSKAVHNAFVGCYTELGLLGYWCWFGLLLMAVVGCLRVRKLRLSKLGDPEAVWLHRFAGMSLAAILGFSASSYFLSRTFVYPFFFLFATLGAVPRVAQRYLTEDAPPIVDSNQSTALLITFGTFVSVVYIYISIILLNKAWYG